MIDTLLIDGQRLDVRAEQRLLPGGQIVRTMTGASSVTLLFHDPDGALRRSGALTVPREKPLNGFTQAPWKDRLGRTVLELDGRRFLLAGVAKQGKTLTLTFEDEIAALLRRYDKPIHSSRGDETRAQFVIRMLREVSERRIDYVVTDPGKRQPIASVDDKDKRRDRGIALDDTINLPTSADGGGEDIPATEDEIRNMNTALDRAVKDDAGERATLALIEACIVEAPNFQNPIGGDSTSSGILQLLADKLGGSTSTNGGRRDISLVCHLFLTQGFTGRGGAIHLEKQHPDWTPGQIAQAVQGSAYPDRYEKQRDYADAILDAYGGVYPTSQQVREQFVYHRGKPDGPKGEDSWACSGRLATDVTWRRFAAENVFYFVTDEDLFKAKPRMIIGSSSPGVLSLDYDCDYGKPASKITITCRAALWTAPEGSIVKVADDDALIDGRWLVDTTTQDPLRPDTTIELRRPAPAKKEPAPKTRTVSTQDTGNGNGQTGETNGQSGTGPAYDARGVLASSDASANLTLWINPNETRVWVASWMIPQLKHAKNTGKWSGEITEGWRSRETEELYWDQHGHDPGLAAPPGQSNHGFTTYPGGAIDTPDYTGLEQGLRDWHGVRPALIGAGAKLPRDLVHFSSSGR